MSKDRQGRTLRVGDWVETEHGHVMEVLGESTILRGVITARPVYRSGTATSLNAEGVTRIATAEELKREEEAANAEKERREEEGPK